MELSNSSKRKLFASPTTSQALGSPDEPHPKKPTSCSPIQPPAKKHPIDQVRSSLEHIEEHVDTALRATLYSLNKGETNVVTQSLERLRQQNKAAVQKGLFHVAQLEKQVKDQEEAVKTKDSYNTFLHRNLSDSNQKLKRMEAQKKNMERQLETFKVLFTDDFDNDEGSSEVIKADEDQQKESDEGTSEKHEVIRADEDQQKESDEGTSEKHEVIRADEDQQKESDEGTSEKHEVIRADEDQQKESEPGKN